MPNAIQIKLEKTTIQCKQGLPNKGQQSTKNIKHNHAKKDQFSAHLRFL